MASKSADEEAIEGLFLGADAGCFSDAGRWCNVYVDAVSQLCMKKLMEVDEDKDLKEAKRKELLIAFDHTLRQGRKSIKEAEKAYALLEGTETTRAYEKSNRFNKRAVARKRAEARPYFLKTEKSKEYMSSTINDLIAALTRDARRSRQTSGMFASRLMQSRKLLWSKVQTLFAHQPLPKRIVDLWAKELVAQDKSSKSGDRDGSSLLTTLMNNAVRRVAFIHTFVQKLSQDKALMKAVAKQIK